MRRFIMAAITSPFVVASAIAAASAAGGVTWTISASIAVDVYKKMHYAQDDFQFFWHGQFLPRQAWDWEELYRTKAIYYHVQFVYLHGCKHQLNLQLIE